MTERPRDYIDADNWTVEQQREVWPDLRSYIADPCTAALFGAIQARQYDPAARAERYARIKAARELRETMRGERPR